MSEAKGPYFVTKQVDDEMGSRWFLVNGPGISDPRMTATADFAEAMMARDCRNIGWKEGRASRDGLRDALMKLRDCDWSIGIGDRMDPVRDIAKEALEADGEGKP